jgi:hypothetical protein
MTQCDDRFVEVNCGLVKVVDASLKDDHELKLFAQLETQARRPMDDVIADQSTAFHVP